MFMSKIDYLVGEDGDELYLVFVGCLASFIELEIMDDDGNFVLWGEFGEIWLCFCVIVLGYFGDLEQIVFEFQDGFWKFGDIGCIDECGFFYIVDCKKDMIISGGFNVYVNEVEFVFNSYLVVLMFVVVGVLYEEWGEVVYVEVMLKEGVLVNFVELIEYVCNELGGYKIFKIIDIVLEIFMSVVGKVLCCNVWEKYWGEVGCKVG